jgi:hypothetical protein
MAVLLRGLAHTMVIKLLANASNFSRTPCPMIQDFLDDTSSIHALHAVPSKLRGDRKLMILVVDLLHLSPAR